MTKRGKKIKLRKDSSSISASRKMGNCILKNEVRTFPHTIYKNKHKTCVLFWEHYLSDRDKLYKQIPGPSAWTFSCVQIKEAVIFWHNNQKQFRPLFLFQLKTSKYYPNRWNTKQQSYYLWSFYCFNFFFLRRVSKKNRYLNRTIKSLPNWDIYLKSLSCKIHFIVLSIFRNYFLQNLWGSGTSWWQNSLS